MCALLFSTGFNQNLINQLRLDMLDVFIFLLLEESSRRSMKLRSVTATVNLGEMYQTTSDELASFPFYTLIPHVQNYINAII